MISLEIILGDDLFLCLCAHRLAPRLLLRAFDSVLEARGLRCGARAAFCDAGFAQFAWSSSLTIEISQVNISVPSRARFFRR